MHISPLEGEPDQCSSCALLISGMYVRTYLHMYTCSTRPAYKKGMEALNQSDDIYVDMLTNCSNEQVKKYVCKNVIGVLNICNICGHVLNGLSIVTH